MKISRVVLLVSILTVLCVLGVALHVASGTRVVAVAEIGINELLPTPTPAPEYRVFINLTSKKIHAEGCYHIEGSDSENIVQIGEDEFAQHMLEGASICSNCEEELKFLFE